MTRSVVLGGTIGADRGQPVSSIALIQRGTCTFGLKTDNAAPSARPLP